MSDYRKRIYQQYVNAREKSLAPDTLEGLRPRQPWFRKIIRDYFPQNRNAVILEIGSGHGAFLHFIRQSGFQNAQGIDLSPEQVAESKRLGIEGVMEGDLLETLKGLPDASQDVVIAIDVIEHFTKDEILELVDAVYRVLRPGGKWIIHTPNGESPFGPRMLYWDYTHEQAFTRNSIHQLLKSSGFSSVISYESAPIPHGIKSAIRFILWKCIRSILLFYTMIETGTYDRSCIFSQNFLTIASK